MTTAAEFARSGITGQTFREIQEKFGKPFNRVAEEDPVMANFAIAFAWFRERERLQVQESYDKALSLTNAGVEALFEDASAPGVQVAADFVSPQPKTTP